MDPVTDILTRAESARDEFSFESFASGVGRKDIPSLRSRLATVGRNPRARKVFDDLIESQFRRSGTTSNGFPELVVGGGLHAAIYTATAKAQRGTPKRIPVLEGARLGGTFATALSPTFYLNSRNRPNELGLPGSGKALNFIPNGAVQPADLDGREYQTNAEFAFAIRANLLAFANCQKVRVVEVARCTDSRRRRNWKYLVRGDNNYLYYTNRVILATGPGVPRITVTGRNQASAVLTFNDFQGLFDRYQRGASQLPLLGWRHVAVIGPQDSGSSVIMALLGQGPVDPGPATLGFVESITWFGQECTTKEQYEQVLRGGSRSLYAPIGRYMPRENEPRRYYRVEPVPVRATAIEVDDSGAARVIYGNGRISRAFDHVVICAGAENNVNDIIRTSVDETLDVNDTVPLREELVYDNEGTPIARKIVGADIYKVGPCADLPVTATERAQSPSLERIPVNSAAAWRYVPRTQRLAEVLHP